METEDMNLEENLNLEENQNLDVVLEPKVGTLFNSEDEAKECYSTYAKSRGFGVVIKFSKKHDNGVKTHISYGCHRSGNPRTTALNPVKAHSTAKIECKAGMNISLQVDGKWMLNSIELNHNHEMDPEKVKYLKCYRNIPPHTMRAIELNTAAGITLNKIIASCEIEAGGPDNLKWTDKDARNHKDKQRRLQLKEGDAEAMHKYFVRMQKDNGDFFYVIDHDEDYRLRNVFWADARSRELYKEFDESNDWLAGLYEERHRWVPAFLNDIFWAGMSSTQRSESMNSYFDGYIHSNTTLKEFVEQYDNALRKKVQKEEEAHARSLNVQIQKVSPYKFENQFQQVYTIAKCKEFRDQVAFKIGCNLTIGPVVNGISEFHIEQDILVGKKKDRCKTRAFLVHFNEELRETNCNCRLFESKGMVCTHMISVWSKKKLEVVPDKYILQRWSKNLIRSHTKIKVSYVNWNSKPEFARYDGLLKLFNEAADKAMYSIAKTHRMVDRLRQIKAEIDLDDEECVSNMATVGDAQIDMESFQDKSITLGDPSKGPRRGRPPTKRKQSVAEQIIRKNAKSNKRQCSRANAKSIPDVEVHTHATGFDGIITQEGETITPSQGSVGYLGTWSYDLNESPF
ncbi:hypothetical protein RHMOL_Rhmol10G0243100 [Rhododendron molle]|uniref:Uncharacterized protein n=1 Tax=Rhododendron molle TaxID=49168 RepID=A0ACC0M6X1_RHOML|nr:hypothetical protein RHMOL_Rhmol10G0243100 [Rhododendron molle]